MKLFLIMLLLVVPIVTNGQQQQQQAQAQKPQLVPTKPTASQPTEEQKASLKQLAEAYSNAQKTADTAKDKFAISLLSIMAELGLKPSDTQLTWDQQGNPVFYKMEAQQATVSKEPKDEKKEKPKTNE